MPAGRSAKRHDVAETFARHYPRPLAELIAAIVHPFDDLQGLYDTSLQAHRAARHELRAIFAPDKQLPSGGEIEAQLCQIANRLFATLRDDAAAELAATRIANALAQLGDAALIPTPIVADDLVAPASTEQFNGTIPFGMWR